jgi:hypothetical protein
VLLAELAYCAYFAAWALQFRRHPHRRGYAVALPLAIAALGAAAAACAGTNLAAAGASWGASWVPLLFDRGTRDADRARAAAAKEGTALLGAGGRVGRGGYGSTSALRIDIRVGNDEVSPADAFAIQP